MPLRFCVRNVSEENHFMIVSLFVSLIFVSFRHLIQEFCYRFNQRMTQYSLRGQLIAYYNSILRLLKDFPNIRSVYRKLFREDPFLQVPFTLIWNCFNWCCFLKFDRKTYFMIGDPHEKKQGTDNLEGLTPDPKWDHSAKYHITYNIS